MNPLAWPGDQTVAQAGYEVGEARYPEQVGSDCGDGPSGDLAWKEVIDELLAIRCLPDDWDGQGSPAPATVLVDRAIALACNLRARGIGAPHRAIAGVSGTVFFEWHDHDGYREIEVSSPDRADYTLIRKGSETPDKSFSFGLPLR